MLTSGGSFALATNTCEKKDNDPDMHYYFIKNNKIQKNIMFNLFEFYVLSVINYCSEVLGYDQCDTLERAHCFVNGFLM